jgi:hypothetical protein
LPYYVFSKFSTLALFSMVQSALFVLVGNHILEIRGMFWPYFFFMFITAASGPSLGCSLAHSPPPEKWRRTSCRSC